MGCPELPTNSVFLFLPPFFPLFSFFPCTEVLEALVGPSKGIPRTGDRGFGPLTQQPENPEPGGSVIISP